MRTNKDKCDRNLSIKHKSKIQETFPLKWLLNIFI